MPNPAFGRPKFGRLLSFSSNFKHKRMAAASGALPVSYNDVLDAARRFKESGRIRRTPAMKANAVTTLPSNFDLYLKLENLQVTGSFKARGATNKFLYIVEQEEKERQQGKEVPVRDIVCASGGNHGLGVAYCGWFSGRQTTIFLPETAPQGRVDKVNEWKGKVERRGNTWDDANAGALALAQETGAIYIHPFGDREVIAGQGTVALEFLEDVPDLDVIICAIGGGGLICGIAVAAKTKNPNMKVIGVEPVGAQTLKKSLEEQHVVTLESVSTKAGTLAPKRSTQINFDIAKELVDDIVLVTDEEMQEARMSLYFELGCPGELAAAAAYAALMYKKYIPEAGQKVGVVICSADANTSLTRM